MPGDGIVPDPMYVTTQAVTIDAPPENVWPWLAQMGAGRGGWYSYDRIDNGGRPSANMILARYQHVLPGAVFPATPGATDAFIVAAAEQPWDLVLGHRIMQNCQLGGIKRRAEEAERHRLVSPGA